MECKVALKLAVAEADPFTVIEHGLLPEHAPLQEEKTDPSGAGEAVKVTLVPFGNVLLQDFAQSIPDGLLTTVPLPDPVIATVS